MMYDTFFFALFGLLVIASAFLVVAWGSLSLRRARELRFKDMQKDRYLVIAGGLTLNAFGAGILFGARIGASLVDKIPPVTVQGIAGAFVALGVAMMLLSKFGFVWGIDLHRRGTLWVVFIAASVLWILFSITWAIWF